MGLLDRFAKKFLRRTDIERQYNPEREAARHVSTGMHSHTGTKAERRTRRKITHESRRRNYQR